MGSSALRNPTPTVLPSGPCQLLLWQLCCGQQLPLTGILQCSFYKFLGAQCSQASLQQISEEVCQALLTLVLPFHTLAQANLYACASTTFVFIRACARVGAHLWKTEDNLRELVLSFYHVVSGYGTQIIRLGVRHPTATHPAILLAHTLTF